MSVVTEDPKIRLQRIVKQAKAVPAPEPPQDRVARLMKQAAAVPSGFERQWKERQRVNPILAPEWMPYLEPHLQQDPFYTTPRQRGEQLEVGQEEAAHERAYRNLQLSLGVTIPPEAMTPFNIAELMKRDQKGRENYALTLQGSIEANRLTQKWHDDQTAALKGYEEHLRQFKAVTKGGTPGKFAPPSFETYYETIWPNWRPAKPKQDPKEGEKQADRAMGITPEDEELWKKEGKVGAWEKVGQMTSKGGREILGDVSYGGVKILDAKILLDAAKRAAAGNYSDIYPDYDQKVTIINMMQSAGWSLTEPRLDEMSKTGRVPALVMQELDQDMVKNNYRIIREKQIRGEDVGAKLVGAVPKLAMYVAGFAAAKPITAAAGAVTKTAVRSALSGVGSRLVVNTAARIAGTAAMGLAQTAVFPSKIVAGAIERQMPGMSIGEDGRVVLQEVQEKPLTSVFKAFGEEYIENVTEFSGPLLTRAGRGLVKRLPAGLRGVVLKIAKGMKAMPGLGKLGKKVAMGRYLEEAGEEHLARLLDRWTGLDPKGDRTWFEHIMGIPGGEDFLTEILTLGGMQAFFRAGTALQAPQRAKLRKAMSELEDKGIRQYYGAKALDELRAMVAATQRPMPFEQEPLVKEPARAISQREAEVVFEAQPPVSVPPVGEEVRPEGRAVEEEAPPQAEVKPPVEAPPAVVAKATVPASQVVEAENTVYREVFGDIMPQYEKARRNVEILAPLDEMYGLSPTTEKDTAAALAGRKARKIIMSISVKKEANLTDAARLRAALRIFEQSQDYAESQGSKIPKLDMRGALPELWKKAIESLPEAKGLAEAKPPAPVEAPKPPAEAKKAPSAAPPAPIKPAAQVTRESDRLAERLEAAKTPADIKAFINAVHADKTLTTAEKAALSKQAAAKMRELKKAVPAEPTDAEAELEGKIQEWMNIGNSRPVSQALVKLEDAGVIEYVEGHSKPGGFYPFTVKIKDPSTGESIFATNPTQVKALAEKYGKAKGERAKPAPAVKEPTPVEKPAEGKGKEAWEMTKAELDKYASDAYQLKKTARAAGYVPSALVESWNKIPASIWDNLKGKGKSVFEGKSLEKRSEAISLAFKHKEAVKTNVTKAPLPVLEDYKSEPWAAAEIERRKGAEAPAEKPEKAKAEPIPAKAEGEKPGGTPAIWKPANIEDISAMRTEAEELLGRTLSEDEIGLLRHTGTRKVYNYEEAITNADPDLLRVVRDSPVFNSAVRNAAANEYIERFGPERGKPKKEITIKPDKSVKDLYATMMMGTDPENQRAALTGFYVAPNGHLVSTNGKTLLEVVKPGAKVALAKGKIYIYKKGETSEIDADYPKYKEVFPENELPVIAQANKSQVEAAIGIMAATQKLNRGGMGEGYKSNADVNVSLPTKNGPTVFNIIYLGTTLQTMLRSGAETIEIQNEDTDSVSMFIGKNKKGEVVAQALIMAIKKGEEGKPTKALDMGKEFGIESEAAKPEAPAEKPTVQFESIVHEGGPANKTTASLPVSARTYLYGNKGEEVEYERTDRKDAKGRIIWKAKATPAEKPTGGGAGTPGFPRGAGGLEKALEPKAKPIGAREIIYNIQRLFRVPIRGKATHHKMAAGWYDLHAQGARMVDVRDISTAVHEIAHHIDHTVEDRISLKPPSAEIAKELMTLGRQLYGETKPSKGYKSEGWAEFVRYYVTGEHAPQMAPATYEWFVNTYLAARPGMARNLNAVKEWVLRFRSQGAEARVESMINRRNIRGPLSETWKRWSLWFRTQFPTEFAPIEEAVKTAGVKKGELPPAENPVDIATAFASKAPGIARYFVEQGTTDLWGNPNGMSLRDAVAPIAKEIDVFTRWMIAARSLDLLERGINPGIDAEDAKFVYDKYDSETFRAAAKEITDWNHRVLDYLVEAGGLTPEAAQKMKALNPIYLPFIRAFSEGEKRPGGGGGGYGVAQPGKPVKAIKGSGREIVDPFETMIRQTERIVRSAHKAVLARSLVNLEATHPGMAGAIWRVPPPMQATRFTAEQMKKEVIALAQKHLGLEAGEISSGALETWDEVLTVYTNASTYYGKDNIVSLTVNGERRWYEVEPNLYRAIQGLDNYQLPWFFDLVFGKANRAVRLGATGINAAFGLIRNPIRDALTFSVFSKHTRLGPLSAFMGVYEDMAQTPEAEHFKAMGGKLSGFIGQDRTAIKHLRDRMLASTAKGKIFVTAKHPIDALRELFGVTEAGIRIAEFKAALAKGEELYGKNTPSAYVYALNAGQDVTINFTRHGKIAKVLNQVIPFFNAGIQGMDKLAREMKYNPAQTILKGIAWLTLPALFFWWRNKDKDWYKELTPYEKANYTHFEIPFTDIVVRLPVPFELGYIFQSGPISALDQAYTDNPDEIKEVFKEATDKANPFDWPAAIGPAIDVIANKSWMGNPIVPMSMQGKRPGDQISPQTTEIMRRIGHTLNISPAKIEYAVNAYSGGVYGRVSSLFAKVPGALEAGLEMGDYPIVGTLFLRDPFAPRRTIERFYDRRDELQANYESRATYPKWKEEDAERKRLNAVARALSPLWKKLREAKTTEERKALYERIGALIKRTESK